MRFRSLDIFRGMTIFLMVMVNNVNDLGEKAKAFDILNHAPWIGFTFADIVFPSFLFAMGTSLSFSRNQDLSNGAYFAKIIKRALILYIVGILTFHFPLFGFDKDGNFEWLKPENIRLLGVLHRTAICYAIVAIMVRYLRPRQLIITSAAILVIYWFMMQFFGIHGLEYNKAYNLGTLIDNFVIPKSHLYQWDDGFEPEGILGTIPSCVNVIAGYLLGRYLKSESELSAKIKNLAFLGLASVALGNLVSPIMPISKKMWTSSFVLLCLGIDLLVMALLIWFYELKKAQFAARFFEINGQNPLAIYVFSETIASALNIIRISPQHGGFWLVTEFFVNIGFTGPIGALGFSIVFALSCWLFGYILYRNRIIIKL